MYMYCSCDTLFRVYKVNVSQCMQSLERGFTCALPEQCDAQPMLARE